MNIKKVYEYKKKCTNIKKVYEYKKVYKYIKKHLKKRASQFFKKVRYIKRSLY